MTTDEISQIATLIIDRVEPRIESAVARGIQNCPMGRDHEIRFRALESWKEGHQALMKERDDVRAAYKLSFWLPLMVLIIGQVINTLLMWHLRK